MQRRIHVQLHATNLSVSHVWYSSAVSSWEHVTQRQRRWHLRGGCSIFKGPLSTVSRLTGRSQTTAIVSWNIEHVCTVRA